MINKGCERGGSVYRIGVCNKFSCPNCLFSNDDNLIKYSIVLQENNPVQHLNKLFNCNVIY